MKVMITGGSGYVGSAIIDELISRGHKVINVDIVPPKSDYGTYYEAIDIMDTVGIHKSMVHNGIDVVIHCAALISVSESEYEQDKYRQINLEGTKSVLSAFKNYGVGKGFVLISSAAVYGNNAGTSLHEDSECAPSSFYGETKFLAEEVVVNGCSHSIPYGIMRLFNVAGSWNLVSDNVMSGHLVPSIIRCLSSNWSLKIYGDDWPTEDGTCVRDYVHVHDVAVAVTTAAERICEGVTIGILNVGSGQGTSVMEMIEAVSRAIGKKISYEVYPRRAGDCASLICSNSKIRKTLGWIPEHSSVDEIAKSAIFNGLRE